ncbi:hypothetical protein CYPRO_3157 [Cyclonatronum proteinivorum]|uniref:Short-chain dehydrogenase n=2 Tax=Cyclonatronum proteinivorum TaxID=1457365 RepID=A0A345UPI9_9BACT|nr:hypothetical protein CYPRO_3157 [Cyclonatronum proteinivorum]
MKTYYNNTIALITGASSGIGREMALQLAALGSKPVLVARRKDRLEQLADEIKTKFGIESLILASDLSKPHAAAALYSAVQEAGLKPDILINNAGFGFQGGFLKGDARTYHEMTMLNMTALTELTYFFLPAMVEQKKGGILNVASMAGFAPIPYFAVYAATKSYVNSFGCALWHEMKDCGVHVTTLCPGPVQTEFFEVSGAKPQDLPVRNIQTAREVSETGLKALSKNEMLVPTSTTLKVMSKISALVPLKANMSTAASFMKDT